MAIWEAKDSLHRLLIPAKKYVVLLVMLIVGCKNKYHPLTLLAFPPALLCRLTCRPAAGDRRRDLHSHGRPRYNRGLPALPYPLRIRALPGIRVHRLLVSE